MAADVYGRVVSSSDFNSEISDLNGTTNIENEPDGLQEVHDDTFREYLPQNSQIVQILTEINTPSRSYVNNNDAIDEYSETQNSQIADFVPNQEFISLLDQELSDLPRDSYVLKLIELTHDSENTITWYRTILASRAKSIQGCPTGKLFTRKSTNRSSSTQKYAKDCYLIYMFINGDDSSIDDVFRKVDHNSISDQSKTVTHDCNIIEMRVTVQTLLERVVLLEKNEIENKRIIKNIKTENDKLKTELSSTNERLNQHLINCERKFTQYDANHKLINQQSKAIGEFDFNSYTAKNVKRFDSELERHSKLSVSLQKNISELKWNSKQSYASKVTPPGTPDSPHTTGIQIHSSTRSGQLSPIEIPESRSPVTCKQNIEKRYSNGINNSDNVTGLPYKTHETQNEGNRDISKPNTENITYKIPVRLEGVTSHVETTNENFFTGVTKNRTARYYLSGIDSKSTRAGILSYLETKNVHVTYLRLFSTRNNDRRISAKLNIAENCAEIVETENFWPKGVYCRKWLSNREWNQRFTDDAHHEPDS
ncbi:unnamed protein product [Mytilus edulis]|uniref:Uncharacterized protein n=1 Tax=Mytilus edulis TaxID=6550 RepID=A0A8S3TFH0_MYTED|nr:unnamed protein product [Mytilus edulis]